MTDKRHEWDPNLDITETKKLLVGGCFVNYYKSKKNGFVSAREQYTLNKCYYNEINQNTREVIYASMSKDFP